jgi:hypothetical protein
MFYGMEDVYVNIQRHSGIKFNTPEEYINASIFDKHEWVLRAETTDVVVTVTAKTNSYAPKQIVASCLLAGLKKVTDHDIYKGACAKVESQFGYPVDRLISSEIAKVDFVEHGPHGARFEVSIIPVIFDVAVSEPTITAYYNMDMHQIKLEMLANDGSEQFTSSISFDVDIWHDNQTECTKVAKFKFLRGLYEQRPELSHLWTQITYNWLSDEEISPNSIAWHNSIQGKASGFKHVGYTNANNQSRADSRVSQLPALAAIVKNPVSGKTQTLRAAIISLNDTFKWTREKIADWLETLDVDISFKVDNNE